ncbi:helix-turn-helix domain-containing protein [Amycolatopsis palatopharyngis]|uniref:helix-turn-helix domain-containing protein n=1 Tax=Amycolatopsis palatopharyngis TaxID=187982 RepID=UPI000E26999C|nr:helix-turn-helix domain-containing protein [Amycolatopsis palatopharyngis]
MNDSTLSTTSAGRRSEFGAALRLAIQRSGLPLSEIHRLLRQQRTPVSVSTLSYWQNGDCQPERVTSLAAVAALEQILGQEQDALTALIGPRRPRGRAPSPFGCVLPHDQVWRNPEEVTRALAQLDAVPEDLARPHKLSQQLSFRVDRNGHLASVRVRRLLQADHDATTSFIFVARCTALPQPPRVTFTQGCAPARFRADVPSSTCVLEFTLDRPLDTGEVAVVEFGMQYPPGQTDEHTQLALLRPARELVLQITFDSERWPSRCHAFFQPRNGQPVEKKREFQLDSSNTVQFITLDPDPGQYGILWRWT